MPKHTLKNIVALVIALLLVADSFIAALPLFDVSWINGVVHLSSLVSDVTDHTGPYFIIHASSVMVLFGVNLWVVRILLTQRPLPWIVPSLGVTVSGIMFITATGYHFQNIGVNAIPLFYISIVGLAAILFLTKRRAGVEVGQRGLLSVKTIIASFVILVALATTIASWRWTRALSAMEEIVRHMIIADNFQSGNLNGIHANAIRTSQLVREDSLAFMAIESRLTRLEKLFTPSGSTDSLLILYEVLKGSLKTMPLQDSLLEEIAATAADAYEQSKSIVDAWRMYSAYHAWKTMLYLNYKFKTGEKHKSILEVNSPVTLTGTTLFITVTDPTRFYHASKYDLAQVQLLQGTTPIFFKVHQAGPHLVLEVANASLGRYQIHGKAVVITSENSKHASYLHHQFEII